MQQDAQRLLLVNDDLRLSEMLRDYLTCTICFLYLNGLVGGAPKTLQKH